MDKPTQRIRNWSETPANNGIAPNVPPYGWPEGQAPSTVNDCARQMMSDLRYQFEDAEWFCWGDVPSRASAATFKVAADITSRYLPGRRLKVYDYSTLYATIVTASYSAPDTTVTLSMDSGSLTASMTSMALSILSPTNSAIPETQSANDAFPALGRLTLTSGTAVTTSDVTAATNIYYTPFKGNTIALHNGSTTWQLFTFAELTLAVAGTTNTMYDIWAYNNSGVVALEATAWTNDTTRATALTKQDGVYVKTGDTTRRYIGSYRTTGSSGQTEDSFAKRYLWNYYNRVLRTLKITDSTTTWTYSSATIRQSNNAAANQIDVVIGVQEDAITISAYGHSSNSGGSATPSTGICVNNSNANNSHYRDTVTTGTGTAAQSYAYYCTINLLGRNFYAWTEAALSPTGTQTWSGTPASGAIITGIFGYTMM